MSKAIICCNKRTCFDATAIITVHFAVIGNFLFCFIYFFFLCFFFLSFTRKINKSIFTFLLLWLSSFGLFKSSFRNANAVTSLWNTLNFASRFTFQYCHTFNDFFRAFRSHIFSNSSACIARMSSMCYSARTLFQIEEHVLRRLSICTSNKIAVFSNSTHSQVSLNVSLTESCKRNRIFFLWL